MLVKSLAVLAVLVALSSAAYSDDAAPGPIDGAWLPASAELAGEPYPEEIRKSIKLVVKDNHSRH